jgi:hypothetical protein
MQSMQQILRGMALLLASLVMVGTVSAQALPDCLIRNCGNFVIWQEFIGTSSTTYRAPATTTFTPVQGTGKTATKLKVCCPAGSTTAVCNFRGKLQDLGTSPTIDIGTATRTCARVVSPKLCTGPTVARTMTTFTRTGGKTYPRFSCLLGS